MKKKGLSNGTLAIVKATLLFGKVLIWFMVTIIVVGSIGLGMLLF